MNLPDICYMDSKAEDKQATRFLAVFRDNFLIQVPDEPMRGDLIAGPAMN